MKVTFLEIGFQSLCKKGNHLGDGPHMFSTTVSVALSVTESKKKAGKDVKEQVFEWVDKHLGYTWPTKVLQSGPRKNQTIIIPESLDMADAWVVANAGFVKLKNL